MNSEKDLLNTKSPASAGRTEIGIRAEKSQTSADEARFIDQKQLLARLPVSRRTLFSWRASGKIPHVKIGRRILFHWPSCEAALLRRQHGGNL
jgi:predicted DNA-binding transcriptional regulator AlpA